ncbi:MAG: ABC transporter permease [Actinomycetia bacterium]|nr:ABC transporter permease [Actinomycetes bacterium]
MRMLPLKRRRDIRRQKWQFVAVLVAVVLGVSLFAGTFNAYLNLGASLDGSYDRLAMAEMTISGADEGLAETVASLDGVATVEERRQADVPMEASGYSFLGRVVGFPAEGEPALNRVDIDEGAALDPDDPSSVVLEAHAAADFELGVGDVFLIAGQEVTIAGIATSPEYLWPARDRQSIFTPPKSFGVAFVDQTVLASLDSQVVVDQVLVRYDEGAAVDELDAAVEAAAAAANAADTQPLTDHPSNATINLEIDGLRTVAVALPLLFLAAAGMAIYVVVTRLVFSQRGVIGTLRATGFSRRRMSTHYLVYGLMVGLIGAAVGVLLGALLAIGMTAIYTTVFGIPDLVARFHWPTLFIAVGFGAVAGGLAGIPPARAVSRLAPAEAMRGDAPPEGGKRSLFETLIPPLRRAPVRWRMSLRGLGRNKRRSLSMVAGVVLAMTLILASWGMMDTMLVSIDRQFNEVALEDAQVFFTVPVGDQQLEALEATAGVAHAEPVVALQTVIEGNGETFTTVLEAYEPATRVHGFDMPLPDSGILLGKATEGILDISVGDAVTIELPGLEVELTTTVGGFVDEPLGTMAYMDTRALSTALEASDAAVTSEILGLPAYTTAKAQFDEEPAAAVIDRIRGIDDVAAAVDSNEIRGLIEDFQVFFYVFIGMMLAFGGAMAFALIFNIISVNVTERSGEFASMRANGLTHRQVASLIVGETFLLTAIGILPGLVAGYLAAVAFMNSFSSDQFPITATLRWFVYVGAALAMFAVASLSLIPSIRAVKRIDVGKIVRERAT